MRPGERSMLNARPMTNNAYKVDMSKNLIRQAVMSLVS